MRQIQTDGSSIRWTMQLQNFAYLYHLTFTINRKQKLSEISLCYSTQCYHMHDIQQKITYTALEFV
jgi:hypothetical protein